MVTLLNGYTAVYNVCTMYVGDSVNDHNFCLSVMSFGKNDGSVRKVEELLILQTDVVEPLVIQKNVVDLLIIQTYEVEPLVQSCEMSILLHGAKSLN